MRKLIPKKLMTDSEYPIYLKLKNLGDNYKIIPQLNLATIINKTSSTNNYNDYSEILILIELNDNTHKQQKRKIRDLKVKEICQKANIPLITFYNNYPNETNYVINRILNEIQQRSNNLNNPNNK